MKLAGGNTPPVASGLPRLRVPKFDRLTLSNGLRVVLLADSRFPSISLRLGLPGGNKADPPSRTGIAETTATMMTDGTPQHTARAIAEISAGLGAQFHFSSSDDFFAGSGTVLEDSFAPFLRLFAECVSGSIFPADELALHKQNRMHELAVERSEAGYWADAKIQRLVFGGHPYAIASPEPAHIARIEREDLLEMAANGFAPKDAVLVLVGDLPPRASLERQLEETLGGWRRDSPARTRDSAKLGCGPAPAMPVHVIHRPGSVQAELRMGRPAPHRLHEDYMALTVLNTLFGGGASCRLFTEIREKQGLAYHVSSSFSALVEGGALTVTTQVAMDRAGDAVRGLHREMRRLIDEPVPAAELQSVRNYMSGVFVLRLESYGSLASQISGVQLLGLGDDYLDTYTDRVAAVTAERLREIASRYYVPEDYALVVAGDAAVLEPQLKEFGAVVVSEVGDSA